MKTTIEQATEFLNESLNSIPEKKILLEEKVQEKELSVMEAIQKVIDNE